MFGPPISHSRLAGSSVSGIRHANQASTASATPAIETRQQVALGRYAELRLPGRYGAAEMPTIEAIDLIRNPPERGRWIAPPLVVVGPPWGTERK